METVPGNGIPVCDDKDVIAIPLIFERSMEIVEKWKDLTLFSISFYQTIIKNDWENELLQCVNLNLILNEGNFVMEIHVNLFHVENSSMFDNITWSNLIDSCACS